MTNEEKCICGRGLYDGHDHPELSVKEPAATPDYSKVPMGPVGAGYIGNEPAARQIPVTEARQSQDVSTRPQGESAKLSAAPAALTREQIEVYRAHEPESVITSQLCNMALRYLEVCEAEPVAWRYALFIGCEEFLSLCSNINWDTSYQPFGKLNVDYTNGVVVKIPLIAAPKEKP